MLLKSNGLIIICISFSGNSDATSVVKNRLPAPIVVKLIRIVPVLEDGSPISLRIEVFGCGEGSIPESTTPAFVVETTKATTVTSSEPAVTTREPAVTTKKPAVTESEPALGEKKGCFNESL